MRPYRYRRRPLNRRQRLALVCFAVALVLIALFLVILFHLRSVLSGLAVTRVSNTVTRVVTAAVNDTISSGAIQYSDLITFEKNGQGQITAMETDMAAFNRVQAAIVDDVLSRLSEVSTTDLAIPLGTLTGSALLAGRGPVFRVRMQFVGSSNASFENEFTEAGINQTKHRIILNVDVSVSILLPGFSTYTKVSNRFTVAETIIVGTVPDSYVYFHGNLEEAEDYVMNNAGP